MKIEDLVPGRHVVENSSGTLGYIQHGGVVLHFTEDGAYSGWERLEFVVQDMHRVYEISANKAHHTFRPGSTEYLTLVWEPLKIKEVYAIPTEDGSRFTILYKYDDLLWSLDCKIEGRRILSYAAEKDSYNSESRPWEKSKEGYKIFMEDKS